MKTPLAKKIIFVGIIIFFVYLWLPSPQEIPALPNSVKSTEPGDTVQIPGVWAYYTNLTRQEVMSYIEKYSSSSLLNIPLITYVLNHPPEIVKDILQRKQRSSYVEEIVHPLRESLFVFGYEWENDPFARPEDRDKNKLYFENVQYSAKITLIQRTSHPLTRSFISFLSLICIFLLYKEGVSIFKEILKK